MGKYHIEESIGGINLQISAEIIKELIRENGISLDADSLKNDMKLEDQGADSLVLMDIFLLIEENFNLTITDDDTATLTTINDLVDFANKKLIQEDK